MTVNKFLNNPDNTDLGFQREFDKLMTESIQAYGHDVIYIPRTLVDEDHLFGEDTISKFQDEGCIEMYIESVDGYDGDKEFVSNFGIELRDQITFIVSQSRWAYECIGDLSRPQEGDLIFMPLTKDLWEIKFTDDDPNFLQQNKNFIYKLTCEKFDYSHEDFDVNIPEVDTMIAEFENVDDSSNDPFSDNIDLQSDGDFIRDFNEDNPWGQE